MLFVNEKELNLIDEYRAYVLNLNRNTKETQRIIVDNWAEGKSDSLLSSIFNDGLIMKKKVSFEKSIDQMVDEYYQIDDKYGYEHPAIAFAKRLRDSISSLRNLINQYNEKDIENYEWNTRPYQYLMRLTNPIYYISNEWDQNEFIINWKNETKLKVHKGEKIMRLIPKICKLFEFSMDGFEEFRLLMSQITNQKKLTGTLCLSIHPLDYMTMSDNNCDWSSCMSWLEGGCYRRGTVEMMMSPYVLVAYLEREDSVYAPIGGNFEWNDKKWRELFVVHDRVLAGIKGYPYHNEKLEKEVFIWIKELAAERANKKYDETIYRYRTACSNKINLNDGRTTRVDFWTDVMYNDFGCNGTYGHPISFSEDTLENMPELISINYSGQAPCMCCGGMHENYNNEGDLTCNCCEGRDYYCCNCENEYTKDEGEWFEGDWYCYECLNECTFIDPFTDKRVHQDDGDDLYLSFIENEGIAYASFYDIPAKIAPSTYKTVAYHLTCSLNENKIPACWSEYFNIPKWREADVKTSYGTTENIKYVRLEDCTSAGLRLFGFFCDTDLQSFKVTLNI